MLTEYHNILFPKAGHACLVSSKPEHVGTPIALYLTCSPDNPPNSLDYTVQAILYVSDEYLDRYEGNTTAVRATIYPVICHQQGVMRADYCRQSSLIQNQLDTCREGSGTYSYFSFHSPDIRATMPWKDKDASAPLRIDFSIDVPTAGQTVLNINLGQWTIEDNMARAWESVETNDKLACGFGNLGLAMASRLRSYAAAIRMQRLENRALFGNSVRSLQNIISIEWLKYSSERYMLDSVHETSTIEKQPLVGARACVGLV